jgi:hypothetical protein
LNIKGLLQKTIEEIWENEIKKDYENNFILNEDTLKMSFCYHLRNKLQDNLMTNNLRIITEYSIPNTNKFVDIAIVEIDEDERITFLHYSEFVKNIFALIELKFIPIKLYKLNPMLISKNIIRCDDDLFKLHDYGMIYKEALLIGAFIDEYFYDHKCALKRLLDISHFFQSEIAKRMTELNGFNYDPELRFLTSVIKI